MSSAVNTGRTLPRALRPLAVVLIALLAVGSLTGCERVEARDRPILLVHGWSITGGVNCQGTFGPLISQLRSEGFTGPIIKVGFYTGDTNCDVNLRDYGNFENGSSWREISKALSHYIHEVNLEHRLPVDLVGFSMGGNIIRGSVHGAARGDAGFETVIAVEDAVSIAGPLNGAAWYSNACLWGQCKTMQPGHADITWLNSTGDAHSIGGTEWTLYGSQGDWVVPWQSAIHMVDLPPERRVVYADIPHTGGDNFMNDPEVLGDVAEALAQPGV